MILFISFSVNLLLLLSHGEAVAAESNNNRRKTNKSRAWSFIDPLPSSEPTEAPSSHLHAFPSNAPSTLRSLTPTSIPSLNESQTPGVLFPPTFEPSLTPTSVPTSAPSITRGNKPLINDAKKLSAAPSLFPSYEIPLITRGPTTKPSYDPLIRHINAPTPVGNQEQLSNIPSSIPTEGHKDGQTTKLTLPEIKLSLRFPESSSDDLSLNVILNHVYKFIIESNLLQFDGSTLVALDLDIYLEQHNKSFRSLRSLAEDMTSISTVINGEAIFEESSVPSESELSSSLDRAFSKSGTFAASLQNSAYQVLKTVVSYSASVAPLSIPGKPKIIYGDDGTNANQSVSSVKQGTSFVTKILVATVTVSAVVLFILVFMIITKHRKLKTNKELAAANQLRIKESLSRQERGAGRIVSCDSGDNLSYAGLSVEESVGRSSAYACQNFDPSLFLSSNKGVLEESDDSVSDSTIETSSISETAFDVSKLPPYDLRRLDTIIKLSEHYSKDDDLTPRRRSSVKSFFAPT